MVGKDPPPLPQQDKILGPPLLVTIFALRWQLQQQ